MIHPYLSTFFNSYFIGFNVSTLFPVTLAFILGIIGHFYDFSPFWLITILPIVLCFTLFYRAFSRASLLIILCATCATLGWWRCNLLIKRHVVFIQKATNSPVSLRGTIKTIEATDTPRKALKVTLQLYEIKTDSQWLPAQETLIITTIKGAGTLDIADNIEVQQISFKETENKGFKRYLLKERIEGFVFVDSLPYTLISRPTWSISRFIAHQKNRLLKALSAKMAGTSFQLFASLFLGNREKEKKDGETSKELFKIWGISHYLARSGLHLVIFVILWHFIITLLPFSYGIKQILIIALLLLYALLSWSSISFERALFMFLLYKGCMLMKLPLHYIHLITLVTLCVLFYNPFQLFFLDFQLSFGITFALAWFNSIQAHKQQGIA